MHWRLTMVLHVQRLSLRPALIQKWSTIKAYSEAGGDVSEFDDGRQMSAPEDAGRRRRQIHLRIQKPRQKIEDVPSGDVTARVSHHQHVLILLKSSNAIKPRNNGFDGTKCKNLWSYNKERRWRERLWPYVLIHQSENFHYQKLQYCGSCISFTVPSSINLSRPFCSLYFIRESLQRPLAAHLPRLCCLPLCARGR